MRRWLAGVLVLVALQALVGSAAAAGPRPASLAIVCEPETLVTTGSHGESSGTATCPTTVTDIEPGGTPPTGIVKFTTDSGIIRGFCGLTPSSGVAAGCSGSWSSFASGLGEHHLSALYEGDETHAPSTGSASISLVAPQGGGSASEGASSQPPPPPPPMPPLRPRLAFLDIQFRQPLTKSRFRIATIRPGVARPNTMFSGSGDHVCPLGTLSWSPDGSQLAFGGLSGSLASPKKDTAIYIVGAAGGTPQKVPGTAGGSDPVWSPDGTRIAFSRDRVRLEAGRNPSAMGYSSTATWIVPAAGGHARRLTPWGNGKSNQPSSFSPDGSHLALTRENGEREPEAVLLDLAGGGIARIARQAEDPSFSPDGSRIALVSSRDGELYVVDPEGGNRQRVTHSRERLEKAPSWDPSGARVAFIQVTDLASGRLSSVIAEVNADGTCPTVVAGDLKLRKGNSAHSFGLTFGLLLASPVWQPGPGRGAGPIAC